MKRLFFLLVLLILTVACSLPEAAQDTTAAIQQEMIKDGAETSIKGVTCEGFFNNMGSFGIIIFQYEANEDSLKLGWEEPYPLFGSGFIHPLKDAELPGGTSFNCDDPQWNEYMLGGQEGEPFILLDGPLKSEFFANLLEIRVPYPVTESEQRDSFLLEVSGVVINPDDANFLTGFKAETAKEELLEFECYGQLIPNSSVFNIIMVGEGTVGELIYITGVAESDDLKPVSESTFFECDGSGQILMNLEEENPSFLLENVGLRPAGGDGDNFIIFNSVSGVGMRIEH